jgi:hypothetical protein
VKNYLSTLKENFIVWLAWKLPRSLAYWAAVRVGAAATGEPWACQAVPDLKMMDVLTRWRTPEPGVAPLRTVDLS